MITNLTMKQFEEEVTIVNSIEEVPILQALRDQDLKTIRTSLENEVFGQEHISTMAKNIIDSEKNHKQEVSDRVITVEQALQHSFDPNNLSLYVSVSAQYSMEQESGRRTKRMFEAISGKLSKLKKELSINNPIAINTGGQMIDGIAKGKEKVIGEVAQIFSTNGENVEIRSFEFGPFIKEELEALDRYKNSVIVKNPMDFAARRKVLNMASDVLFLQSQGQGCVAELEDMLSVVAASKGTKKIIINKDVHARLQNYVKESSGLSGEDIEKFITFTTYDKAPDDVIEALRSTYKAKQALVSGKVSETDVSQVSDKRARGNV